MDLARRVRPVPKTAKFEDENHYIWCGSMVAADDGRCHLYYSRWPRTLGFNAWVTHSEIAHAVADTPLGPYRFVDTSLPPRGKSYWDGLCTHNPTVLAIGGKFYLYYMGNTGDGNALPGLNWTHRNRQRIGVAIADHPGGPWRRFPVPLIDTTPGFHDALCCANPSVTPRIGGGFLMIYKGVGDRQPLPFGGPVVHIAATSASPTGPFIKQPDPIFTREGVSFAAEDPFIWQDGKKYWAIVKDMAGHFTRAGRSLALFTSDDGLRWRPADAVLAARTEIIWADGERQRLRALERPQLWRDRNNVPSVLFCAAQEEENPYHTFNVAIPLGPIVEAV